MNNFDDLNDLFDGDKTIKRMNASGIAVLILVFIVVLGLFFGLMCIFNAIGLWLWTTIAVNIFGLPALTFWQFFGLNWLCTFLFKGRIPVNFNSKEK